jgi:malate/lactate dehydrogenase
LKEKLRKTWWKEKFDMVLYDSLEKLGLDSNYKGIPQLLDSNGIVVNLTSSNLSQELQRGNINTIIKKLKVRNSSISKDDSTYLKGILKNMFDNPDSFFLQIYNPLNSGTNKFFTLRDFYTSKKINTTETLKQDEYIDIIQKIYSTYEKHYQKYEIPHLQ